MPKSRRTRPQLRAAARARTRNAGPRGAKAAPGAPAAASEPGGLAGIVPVRLPVPPLGVAGPLLAAPAAAMPGGLPSVLDAPLPAPAALEPGYTLPSGIGE